MEDRNPPKTKFVAQGGGHPRSVRITEEKWDLYKPLLCKLYRSYTLQVVMTFMQKRFDFTPTKRQYGYRFEKWGIKKYGALEKPGLARGPIGNEETPYEQIESDLAANMPQYLDLMTADSNSLLEVPISGRSHRARSIASATSGNSDNAASLVDDDADAEDLISWGPEEENKKLMADFCSSMSDEENAFALYQNLVEFPSNDPQVMKVKTILVTSCARVANRPGNAKRARELLSRLASSKMKDRAFLFPILDAFMEEIENPTRKDEARRRIRDTVGRFLEDDTTLKCIPNSCAAINLVTYSFLSSALEVYEKTPAADNGATPMLSIDDLMYEYVYRQPFAQALLKNEPSILRVCISWCEKQLRPGQNEVPSEVAFIHCDDQQRPWCDDIRLYCTLWHCMVNAVNNGRTPAWYSCCEDTLGISPSELLVNVCWMIGAEGGEERELPDELLSRALAAVLAIARWAEPKLWIRFLRRFRWMNKLVDLGDEEKAFEDVILQHTRRFVSSALNTTLPFPAEEVPEVPDLDFILEYDAYSAMDI